MRLPCSVPTATRRVTFAPAEGQTLYAHLPDRRHLWQPHQPDHRPDLVDAPQHTGFDRRPDDTAWLESGGSLVGSGTNALHVADPQRAVQQFYTTWNADTLRMTWTGANWDATATCSLPR